MANSYEHTQKNGGWIYLLAIPVGLEFVFIAVILGVLNAHSEQPVPQTHWLLFFVLISIIPIAVLTWIFLMMSSLTVLIDETFISIRFGAGMWKKKFKRDKVVDIAPVKNTWSNGWGIHYIGKRCWLYNIAGSDAVELTFQNGKKARIGTDEPEKLAAAIESAIKIK